MGATNPADVRAGDDPRRPRALDAGQPRARLRLARVGRARGARSGSAPMDSGSADALHNRARWDADADDYQARNRELLAGAEPRWGMWQLPEAELQMLGEVAGKDVLEYRLRRGAVVDPAGAAWAHGPSGWTTPAASSSTRAPAGGGRRRVPARPRERGRGAVRRRELRRRLLRSRGDDVRRPVPDRARGGSAAPPRRRVRVLALDAALAALLARGRERSSTRSSIARTSTSTGSRGRTRRSSSRCRRATGSGSSA